MSINTEIGGVRILKPFSNLTIKLKEQSDAKETEKKDKIKKEDKKNNKNEVNK